MQSIDTAESMNTPVASLHNAAGSSPVLLVCEHASNWIPPQFGGLGVPPEILETHIAWDIGALDLAVELSGHLNAALVASEISRLVYDVNRAPGRRDAMPHKSEVFEIPGNTDIGESERRAREAEFYHPFERMVAEHVQTRQVLITVHSFTPVYFGKPRDVDIGILHDTERSLADAMLACASKLSDLRVRRNAPYAPEDGVMHTINRHGVEQGRPNVMIEVRNDLLLTNETRASVASILHQTIIAAVEELGLGPQTEVAR